jgi:uncharacterized protein YjbJ (UPF0337 family)
MSEGRFDEAKGRAKKAAGEVSGDEDLQREGQAEKTSGTVKEKFNATIDRVKRTFSRRDR